jgi:hypothetical protein
MPLSPSDVTYINKLMDRHLKSQQSWPWVRYFVLTASVFSIAVGAYLIYFAPSFVHFGSLLDPQTTRPTIVASTLPVTHAELQVTSEYLEVMAGFKSELWSVALVTYLLGLFFCLLGIYKAEWALTKWNHHRRDAILITLLREKCAAELAPPDTAAKVKIDTPTTAKR